MDLSQPITQLIVVVGAIAASLITFAGVSVGALCYFLRRLVNKTIPDMGERFERVNLAQLAEMQAGRDDCKEEHAAQEEAAKRRHSEVMEAIRRPFAGPRSH